VEGEIIFVMKSWQSKRSFSSEKVVVGVVTTVMIMKGTYMFCFL